MPHINWNAVGAVSGIATAIIGLVLGFLGFINPRLEELSVNSQRLADYVTRVEVLEGEAVTHSELLPILASELSAALQPVHESLTDIQTQLATLATRDELHDLDVRLARVEAHLDDIDDRLAWLEARVNVVEGGQIDPSGIFSGVDNTSVSILFAPSAASSSLASPVGQDFASYLMGTGLDTNFTVAAQTSTDEDLATMFQDMANDPSSASAIVASFSAFEACGEACADGVFLPFPNDVQALSGQGFVLPSESPLYPLLSGWLLDPTTTTFLDSIVSQIPGQ